MINKYNAFLGLNIKLSALVAGLLLSHSASAIDVNAGDYTALPAGTNLAMVYYQNTDRNSLYAGGNEVAGDYSLRSEVGILRGIHFMDIGGYTVDPQFLLPFGSLEAGKDVASLGKSSGVGDLVLAATVWLVGDAATDTYFGITPFLYVPTGEYDSSAALNLGENRWKFSLQAGYITGLTDKISLDLIGDVTLYGKNDEFGLSEATMKQDPSFQLQAHLRYKITPTWDIRTSLSQSYGGKTQVNDVKKDDAIDITKITIGTAYFATPSLQLMFNYGRDLSVENGFKEHNRLNFRILKAF